MIKSIIRETFIMLLLCVAIILILGVLFYEYIPTNKVIPNKLATYSTAEKVKTEIDEKVTEMEKAEISYEITSSDLTLYKQSNSYNPGKVDPFSASPTVEPEGEQNTTNTENGNNTNTNTNTNTSTNTNNSGTTNTDPNSTGTFFNNTGLK